MDFYIFILNLDFKSELDLSLFFKKFISKKSFMRSKFEREEFSKDFQHICEYFSLSGIIFETKLVKKELCERNFNDNDNLAKTLTD